MADRKWERIEDNIYKLNGVVYAQKTHNGKTYKKKTPMQGSLALTASGKITAECRKWCRQWAESIINMSYLEEQERAQRRVKGVSFKELIAAYEKIAAAEYMRHGEPKPRTASFHVTSLKQVIRELGIPETATIGVLTRQKMEQWVTLKLGAGMRRISAWSILVHARCLAAKWTLPLYADMGLSVTPFEAPSYKHKSISKYNRPPEELRRKTLEWYQSLLPELPEMWVAVTLMLEFAMRNGDALRVTWDNFRMENGIRVLTYMPHKTAERTGGRSINWPVSEETWEKLRRYGGEKKPLTHVNIYPAINKEMRALGWVEEKYSKGAYELRKMCIDAVYTRFGIEKAVQISGDNFQTVSTYYLDPSRSQFAPLNVASLFTQ